MIESGPIPAVHGVVRWRLIDLAQWIFEEFRITIAKQTLSRELRAMGYRKLSARPRHHAQAQGAIEDFKKASPRAWKQSRAQKALDCDKIEIWFADEARIGQKNKITRRWAKRGTRPSAPRDQRTASTYIFGAVCPKRGQGRSPDPAGLQYRGDEPAPRGDRRRPLHPPPTLSSWSTRPAGTCPHASSYRPTSPFRVFTEAISGFSASTFRDAGALDGQKLEICWLEDPFDLLAIQIEGSGRRHPRGRHAAARQRRLASRSRKKQERSGSGRNSA